jgi:hypothetical protein
MLCYRVVGAARVRLPPFLSSAFFNPYYQIYRAAIYLTPHKYNFSTIAEALSVVKMEIPSASFTVSSFSG